MEGRRRRLRNSTCSLFSELFGHPNKAFRIPSPPTTALLRESESVGRLNNKNKEKNFDRLTNN